MSARSECGNKLTEVLKEWNYHLFHVKNIYCKKCGFSFNEYYKDGEFSHIIDYNKHEPQRSILRYLRTHEVVKTEEIAKALNLDCKIVLNMLMRLEKRGIIDHLSENKDSK